MFADIAILEIDDARLAEQARLRRPDLKIPFTTGHTRDPVIRNETLASGANLVAKPFIIERLGPNCAKLWRARRLGWHDKDCRPCLRKIEK
jgi:hypothetical protein